MNLDTPVTEAELKAKAVAPRVTEGDLDSYIAHCNFVIVGLLTICVLTLKNGFTTTGESACASPENFDEEIGKRLSFTQARNKLWPLLGFKLRDCLYQDQLLLDDMAFTAQMPTYIGTKAINAKPMTRGDYNELRGWQLPANEDPADEGYLVEYTDRIVDEDKQVGEFLGYISWSPKETFEKAYRPALQSPGPREPEQFELNLKPVTTHVERMELEHKELLERSHRLRAFMDTDAYLELSQRQRTLLGRQHHHMTAYEGILAERLELVKAGAS